MEQIILTAKYVSRDEGKKGLLEIKGSVTVNLIDRVFLDFSPRTYAAERVEEGKKRVGQVRFVVGSQSECTGLVKKLNTELNSRGFSNYRVEYKA